MKIITQTTQTKDHYSNPVKTFFDRFDLATFSRQANAARTKGFSFSVVFSFIVQSIFSNGSTYRFYQKQTSHLPFSDKTFRNLLNDSRINWQKLLLLLAKAVSIYFTTLTAESRRNVFIIDDSMYARTNAKKVEGAALQYDHAKKKYVKGFRFLQLGWSDGNSFLPVSFSLLSGKNQICETPSTDQRTNSGKRQAQAHRKGTDVAVELVRNALKQGIQADYVLFDTWFSSPKMFHQLKDLGCHCVAMVKRTKKVHYRFDGQSMDAKEIFQLNKKRRGRSRYLLSVSVEAVVGENSMPLKLVFVRNRNKRNEYLILASTDTSLTEDEIIQLYGRRWAIEVYFKMCKQYLKLTKYQGLSYDGIFAHTTAVAIAYMILAVQEREASDDRTIGELFYLLIDELSEIPVAEAIRQLVELFEEVLIDEYVLDEMILDNILGKFIAQLPKNLQKQLICGA